MRDKCAPSSRSTRGFTRNTMLQCGYADSCGVNEVPRRELAPTETHQDSKFHGKRHSGGIHVVLPIVPRNPTGGHRVPAIDHRASHRPTPSVPGLPRRGMNRRAHRSPQELARRRRAAFCPMFPVKLQEIRPRGAPCATIPRTTDRTLITTGAGDRPRVVQCEGVRRTSGALPVHHGGRRHRTARAITEGGGCPSSPNPSASTRCPHRRAHRWTTRVAGADLRGQWVTGAVSSPAYCLSCPSCPL